MFQLNKESSRDFPPRICTYGRRGSAQLGSARLGSAQLGFTGALFCLAENYLQAPPAGRRSEPVSPVIPSQRS